jgi:hypothetical protein
MLRLFHNSQPTSTCSTVEILNMYFQRSLSLLVGFCVDLQIDRLSNFIRKKNIDTYIYVDTSKAIALGLGMCVM